MKIKESYESWWVKKKSFMTIKARTLSSNIVMDKSLILSELYDFRIY